MRRASTPTASAPLAARTALPAILLCSAAMFVPAAALSGQNPATLPATDPVPPVGRAAVDALRFEPLDFEQPAVDEHEVRGVNVLLMEDRALPLVSVHAYFRGGYGRFDRSWYAAATGLPALMRYGGTATRTPTEVDEAIAFYALQVSFGTGGGSITTSINTLTEHVDVAIALWSELLVAPAFDAAEIDAWRARQLEGVRRRADDPGRLAVVEINRLLFGDHPVGWEMAPEDLAPELLTPERLHELRGRIVCRENLVLGFTGDISWPEAQPLAERLLARLPACLEPLPTEPAPQIRRAPGVFLLAKDVEQAVVVMAHPTAVRLADDDDYYSALIGNSILGAGGFSSRLMHRLRTEEGFAYSATSLWTTPRTHDGVVGAMTQTRPENVAPAIDVVLQTMATLRDAPPSREEVATTVDQIVNGFVFNFDSPDQIVSRTMYYRALDLPNDWLQRYWNGVQRVDPESVHGVFQRHLKPEEMTILVVGDPVRIGVESLRRFGPVLALDVETGSTTPFPSGSPRFRPIPGSTPRR